MTFAISVSLTNLLLYCVQQFGVTIGVGAETVLLVAYIQSMRDGFVDDTEKGFAKAVRRVKDFGLFFIITSGLAIAGLQFLVGALPAFLSTIVLFKWSLIGIALFASFFTRGTSLTSGLMYGLSGGTWYALFAVHILAPGAPWTDLAVFYSLWLVGFALCWTVVVFSTRGAKPKLPAVVTSAIKQPAKASAPAPAVKPVQPKPVAKPAPPPVLPQPVVVARPEPPPVHVPEPVQTPEPAKMPVFQPVAAKIVPKQELITVVPGTPQVAPASQKPPVVAPSNISPLHLRVMPRTPEELLQHKAHPAA